MLILINWREYETPISVCQEERSSVYTENLIILLSNYHHPQFVYSS